MTKYNGNYRDSCTSFKAIRFADNWLVGAAQSKSARRRLNAILRLACRTLGLKRAKGLGMLGIATAVMVGVASPVIAQTNSLVITDAPSIGKQPAAAGIVTLDRGFTLHTTMPTSGTDSNQIGKVPFNLSFTALKGTIITSPNGAVRANGVVVPLNVPLDRDYFFEAGKGTIPASTIFDGPVTMEPRATGAKITFPAGTIFPAGTTFSGGDGANLGVVPGVPTTKAVTVEARWQNGSISYPPAANISGGFDGRFTQLKVNTDAAHKPAMTSSDVVGDVALGGGATAIGAKGAAGIAVPATAVGQDAKATGAGSTAVGTAAEAGDNATSIGNAAKASHKNGVALGAGSVTKDLHPIDKEIVINGKSYSVDSSNATGVVSIGSESTKRQIINVAPGKVSPDSTDATNGAQLNVAYDAIKDLGTIVKAQDGRLTTAEGVVKSQGETIVTQSGQISALEKDALLYDGTAYNANHDGKQSRIANVADGVEASDAVNKSQLDTLQQALNSGSTGLVQSDASGDTLAIGGDSTAKVVDLGGKTPQLDANGQPVIGADGKPVLVDADRTVTGIADGVAKNDAVNKGQLDIVDGKAVAAQKSADDAQKAADAVQVTADGSAKQLAGIGADETVADRITAAAGTVGKSVADAFGEGAVVDADGKVTLPTLNLSSLGKDSNGNDIAQPTTIIGGISALDTVVKAQDGRLTTAEGVVKSQGETIVTQSGQISALEKDALLYDGTAYNANHDGKQSRIANVADGVEASDAVNKSQLDTLQQALNSGSTGLVQSDASGDTLAIGGDSTAKVVDLGGKTPQLDANGQPVIGADGKPVLVDADRTVTGIADGVAKNDAVNKGQLDIVDGKAVAAQKSADDAQKAADAVQVTADGSAKQLAGIGADETVADRITAAAGTVGKSVADAFGEGAVVDADGKVTLPTLNLSSLGKDSNGNDIAQPTTIIGGISALDTVVKAQDGRLTTAEGVVKSQGETIVTQSGQISALEKDALLYDGTAYNANHDGKQSRIANVADGVEASDAVNKSQLDTLQQALNSGSTGLVQSDASGDTLAIGGDSTAKVVDLGGKTPQLDANGQPVIGADGKPVLVDADRTVTGIADGVAKNDAVNKGQLDIVDGKAVAAQKSADDAQKAADAVQVTADGSAKQLAGIGADETVADRITAAAGTVGKSVADAFGEGAVVDADGKVTLPTLNLSSLGKDSNGNDIAQPTTIIGGISALDTVVKAQDGRLTTAEGVVKSQGETIVTQSGQISALEKDALLYDGTAYNANHDGKQSRIANVADGVEASDAVNKSQLDTLQQALNSGSTGLVQSDASGDTLAIGGDSTAKVVDLGGKTPQLDANGQPVIGADGKPVLVDADRTVTGIADGVAKNDAVNKGQLDIVDGKAVAAQKSADDAQKAADAVQVTADGSAKQLAGIGADETVADRITAAAGTVGKSVADAFGEGAVVDADGKVTLPTLNLSSLGKDSNGNDIAQPTTIIGGISALDTVVKAQDGRLTTAEGVVKSQGETIVTQSGQISALEKDALLYDGTAYNANHDGKQSRIANVADGVEASDAVNKSQLDTLQQALNSGSTGLVQSDASGDTLAIGGDSTAKVVDLGGKTPQLDANGQPVIGADGKPVLVDADRTVTGIADGVAKNDAVNKGQLDIVDGKAVAAQKSADDAQKAADAVQVTADGSAKQLAGIGADETVADRITAAAGTVGKSVADAFGEGAVVDADGKVTLPTLNLSSLGKDSNGNDIAQPTTIIGGISALDTVVKAQDGRLTTAEGVVKSQGETIVTQSGQISALEKDALLYDGTAYNANHDGKQSRIANVADGVEASDAVNKSQLDTVTEKVDAVAAVNNLTIKYDTDETGHASNTVTMIGANNGDTVTITNVADGVNETDAVNRKQLDKAVTNAQSAAASYDTDHNGNVDKSSMTFNRNGAATVLRNVAPGRAGTDAANVNQLNAVSDQVDGLRSDMHRGFASLDNSIRQNQKEARQGIAAAMAMSSATMPSAAGKTSWATNAATFHNEFAIGASVAHRLDTDNPFAISGAVSWSGNNVGVRVGLMGEF